MWLGYPKVISYITKFEHFGIIRFWVTLRTNKQTNKQTDKQTASNYINGQSAWLMNETAQHVYVHLNATDLTLWSINDSLIEQRDNKMFKTSNCDVKNYRHYTAEITQY